MEMPGVLHDMPHRRVMKPFGGGIDGGVHETVVRHAKLHRLRRSNKPSATKILIITGFLGNRGDQPPTSS